MFADLALASWATVMLRMSRIAQGTCTPAEYSRMVTEKLLAAQRSAVALTRPGRNRGAAALRPWRTAARRNAKRLARKRR
jgi:hypothetical protein